MGLSLMGTPSSITWSGIFISGIFVLLHPCLPFNWTKTRMVTGVDRWAGDRVGVAGARIRTLWLHQV